MVNTIQIVSDQWMGSVIRSPHYQGRSVSGITSAFLEYRVQISTWFTYMETMVLFSNNSTGSFASLLMKVKRFSRNILIYDGNEFIAKLKCTVFDLISGLSAYVILGPKNRPN